MSTTSTASPQRATPPPTPSPVPGVLLAALGTAAAAGVHLLVPGLSTVIAAVILGVLVGNLPVALPGWLRPGLQWATKHLLRIGVVFLGLKLALPQLLDLGVGTLVAVMCTVVVGFFGTMWLGRILGVGRSQSILIATGFSICGASAIAGVEGVIEREDEEVATGVGLVTLFGGLSIFMLPLLGSGLGMSQEFFGEWSGISVHEVAQVVATASGMGGSAVALATVVKLARVLLLAPTVALVNVAERRRGAQTAGKRPPIIPWFVAAFLVMVVVRSLDVLPHAVFGVTGTLTELLLAAALFGLGSSVRIPSLVRTGPRAILLGLCSTVLLSGMGGVSLALLS